MGSVLKAAVAFSERMGGLAASNLLGGSVHALFSVKVNEIKQGVGTTAAGVVSHMGTLNRDSEKPNKQSSSLANYLSALTFPHSTADQEEFGCSWCFRHNNF